ncbi:MAG: metal-dependent transcriptional regulator [Lachnospiraceae bacterium]|nr:metal-dependent transcriptional regulator [Lachnospiraceae bacterium]
MSYIKHKSKESVEDYLETILMLEKRLPYVRSIDIAHELDYSKPSVSVAMRNLREQGYVDMDDYGHIHLTDIGRSWAKSVLERHELLTEWLIKLGVEKTMAEEDACRLEHDMSDETFAALKKHILETL